MSVTQRLADLGLSLPQPSIPVAAYVPFVVNGNQVFISGQLPLENRHVKVTGRLGENVTLDAGYAAARLCGLNILAHLKNACRGDLECVRRCVRLGGFVAATTDFFDHPKVINGASELMQQVFGEIGAHARFAVGVASLPLNAAVEIDAIFEIAL